MEPGVNELTAGEFAEQRPNEERVSIEGRTFVQLHQDLEGVRPYRGIDRRTALAFVERDGRFYRVFIELKVAERWVGDVTDDTSRAARHVMILANRAVDAYIAQ